MRLKTILHGKVSENDIYTRRSLQHNEYTIFTREVARRGAQEGHGSSTKAYKDSSNRSYQTSSDSISGSGGHDQMRARKRNATSGERAAA